MAETLAIESGGVLVDLFAVKKTHAIIVYRGKNYSRPKELRPRNLLTKRQALKRSIEMQRREVCGGEKKGEGRGGRLRWCASRWSVLVQELHNNGEGMGRGAGLG